MRRTNRASSVSGMALVEKLERPSTCGSSSGFFSLSAPALASASDFVSLFFDAVVVFIPSSGCLTFFDLAEAAMVSASSDYNAVERARPTFGYLGDVRGSSFRVIWLLSLCALRFERHSAKSVDSLLSSRTPCLCAAMSSVI